MDFVDSVIKIVALQEFVVFILLDSTYLVNDAAMILSKLLVYPPLIAIVANFQTKTCQVPLRWNMVQG